MITRHHTTASILAGVFLVTGALVAPAPAQQITGFGRQVIARTNQNLESIDAVRKGFDTFGRRWGDLPPQADPVPAPTPQAPVIVGGRNAMEIRTGLVNLAKTVPAQVGLGETYACELLAAAVEDAAFIEITDTIPDGASFVRAEPAASRDGSMLGWRIPVMHKGEVQRITVWLKAERIGELTGCATIHAVPRKCVTTVVGQAALEVLKTGPASAKLNSTFSYRMLVRNAGNTTARNVVVKDTLPAGLELAAGGSELNVPVGDLAPGQAKEWPVPVRATKRGRHVNSATATASNAASVSAEAATEVVLQSLKLVKTGDREQFLSRRATYEIVVSNTGDTPLNGVTVTDTAPAETAIVAADGATMSGNTAVWRVGTLRPGEEKRLGIVLTARTPGTFANTVAAVTDEGLRETSSAPTLWRGVSALLLEKWDDRDPVQIGETTTYTVRVTNQGTGDTTNVAVLVAFPRELLPIAAEGGRIDGQTVTFPATARLAPKANITYTIKARGVSEGDVRVKFSVTADGLRSPVNADESTLIY